MTPSRLKLSRAGRSRAFWGTRLIGARLFFTRNRTLKGPRMFFSPALLAQRARRARENVINQPSFHAPAHHSFLLIVPDAFYCARWIGACTGWCCCSRSGYFFSSPYNYGIPGVEDISWMYSIFQNSVTFSLVNY